MIIAINGKAGSGKSTIAKTLAKKLDYKHYSMGDFQRELALENNMTIEQWGEYQIENKEVDIKVDDKQIKLGKEEDNFVIDAWLGACFIPQAFKIFLDVDINEAMKRRVNQKRDTESFDNIEEAKKSLLARAEVNRNRWIKLYKYDYMNMDNYDLVIDTTNLTPELIIKKILEEIKDKV